MVTQSMRDEMTRLHGKAAMARSPSRDELYNAIDIITDTIGSHKQRLDALEGQKGMKPRYRVPAETRSI